LTILVNQICRLFSIPQTLDSIIAHIKSHLLQLATLMLVATFKLYIQYQVHLNA